MKFMFFKLAAGFIAVLCFVNFSFAQQSDSETGIELYEKKDYEAAAKALEKAVETDASDGMAWRFLGMAYARLNKIKEARRAFDKADDFKDADLNAAYDKPGKIISKRPPQYNARARENGVQGTIKVAVEFGADGRIRYVVPIRGLPDGLTENVVKAASEIKFEPAIKNDKPVTVIKFVEYSFRIF